MQYKKDEELKSTDINFEVIADELTRFLENNVGYVTKIIRNKILKIIKKSKGVYGYVMIEKICLEEADDLFNEIMEEIDYLLEYYEKKLNI